MEKPFLFDDGRVGLEGKLDRAIYAHGDSIVVQVHVNNNSRKSVRRIKVRSVFYWKTDSPCDSKTFGTEIFSSPRDVSPARSRLPLSPSSIDLGSHYRTLVFG